MADVNWRREMNKMLWIIERQATDSLLEIGRDQSLDDEFQRLFLRVTNKRLATTFSLVQLRLNNMNQGENDRGQEQASVSDLLGTLGNGRQFVNSLGDDLDPQPNQNTNIVNISDSVKQEVTEANEVDDVVEIFDTSDEEDSGELSGIQLSKIKIDCENGKDNEIESIASMNVNNGEGKSDDVFVKNEIYDDWLKPKQEVIEDDIPIRIFNPNDDSMNNRSNRRTQPNDPICSLETKGSMKTAEADLSMNQKSDELRIKEEFDIKPKQEMIDEEIPIRTFNPKNVSNSNGGYSTRNDATNKNDAASSSQLKGDTEKPSCSKDSKRFNCELCEYGTDYKGNFNKHMRIHNNEKLFQCSRCFERFTQSSHLKAHLATHKDEFPFHCSKCFRGFFQDNEKRAHEKSCRDRRYECFICKYFTVIKTNLVIHMPTHTGNKPYRCSRCSKGFTTLRSLKIHMMTHKDKNLPFHCKGCFRRFPKESEKKGHEKNCRYRRYECDICNKFVTAYKTQMENHMRVHTGGKPFHCEVCMKCFSVKCNLKRHLNTIHNKRNL